MAKKKAPKSRRYAGGYVPDDEDKSGFFALNPEWAGVGRAITRPFTSQPSPGQRAQRETDLDYALSGASAGAPTNAGAMSQTNRNENGGVPATANRPAATPPSASYTPRAIPNSSDQAQLDAANYNVRNYRGTDSQNHAFSRDPNGHLRLSQRPPTGAKPGYTPDDGWTNTEDYKAAVARNDKYASDKAAAVQQQREAQQLDWERLGAQIARSKSEEAFKDRENYLKSLISEGQYALATKQQRQIGAAAVRALQAMYGFTEQGSTQERIAEGNNRRAIDVANITGNYNMQGRRMDADTAQRGQNMTYDAAMRGHDVSRQNNADTNARYGAALTANEPLRKAQADQATAEALRIRQNTAANKPTQYDAAIQMLSALKYRTPEQENRLNELLMRQSKTRFGAGTGATEGFASGGPVSQAMDMANPMRTGHEAYGMGSTGYDPHAMAQYGQYLTMAKRLGLPPLPLESFLESRTVAMAQAQQAQRSGPGPVMMAGGGVIDKVKGFFGYGRPAAPVQATQYDEEGARRAQEAAARMGVGSVGTPQPAAPVQQAVPVQPAQPNDLRSVIDRHMAELNSYASGGAIPVAGRQVIDPNHGGEVDSIPAVIDGEQRAALNSGEVVIPADIVQKLGTEYFDKLIAKYHHSTKPQPAYATA